MHLRIWELLADTLLWLQLGLICSGFVLMGYLSFKVFPDGSDPEASQRVRIPPRVRSRSSSCSAAIDLKLLKTQAQVVPRPLIFHLVR